MSEEFNDGERQISLYHACVKGYGDFTIYIDDADYIAAVNYIALAQRKSQIVVLAFCHMPNHTHFILGAEGMEDIGNFLYSFERAYAMFFSRKYGENNIFKRQDNFVKEIHDIMYLRKCIAYVLRNPLVAGLVKSSVGYPWSSRSCYFSGEGMPREFFPITSVTARQIRENLRTHADLKNSGYHINDRWMIAPKSFVDYKTVEAVYSHSASNFLSYLGYIDDQKLEYDLIIKDFQKYDDIEMKDIVNKMSVEKYKKRVDQLLPEQKRELAGKICRRYRTSAAQLSRVLKVRKDLLLSLFP